MTTNKRFGGLGIQDPSIQQLALFYKWVDPLLFERPERSLVQQFLYVHLANQFKTSNVLMCLLFPLTRPRIVGANVSTITLVCRTVDIIPRRQFTYIPCPLDALLLPLRAIIDPACHYMLPRALTNAAVSDLYEYHLVGHFLSPKRLRTDIPFNSNSVTRFRNATANGNCLLSPWFIQCMRPTSLSLYNAAQVPAIKKSLGFYSFRRRLHLSMDETSLSNPSTSCKAFRDHITKSHNSSILHQQEITHASWSRFWRLTLTTVQPIQRCHEEDTFVDE
ncbi:uncharacterized protein B0P05DRAFT_592631 [Gilbertella persicaria]|uniref:uncharacterized protein n=1 Tax=Gilbertella persicaria TaxID=101096 RepID=UPI00221EBD49|nr:uncharacterized protein B0P05DRAFT_592631 [Gilbertella persicaria]KAI8047423.1 hypothetical protein B0P05DRAFT_592631 [Gilbertella persicaria]